MKNWVLILLAVAGTLTALGCSTPVDPSEYDQVSPNIAGNVVVWEDSRNFASSGSDIFMYDAYSATETRVTQGMGDEEQPAISSSYVVWLEQGRLRAWNRQTPLGTVINVTNGSGTASDPALCGSVVTWTDARSGTPNVYARNLANWPNNPEINVDPSSAIEGYPACDQGRIVYMYAPSGQFARIRMYDMATHQVTSVADAAYNQWRPAISGNLVVWQAWPFQPDVTTGIQIFGRDLSDPDPSHIIKVSEAPNHQTAPTVSGSVVAWEDARNGTQRVWWRDLADGTTTQRAADPLQAGQQQAPALSGRLLTYQSDDTGPWNVYTVPLFVPPSTTAMMTQRQLRQCASSAACVRRVERRLAARIGNAASRQLVHYMIGRVSRGGRGHAALRATPRT
jgi:beta propeller repeat protein